MSDNADNLKKEEYRRKKEAELKELQAKIDELEAKAKKTEAEANIKYMEEIDKLKSKRNDLQDRMEQLKTSGKSAWNDLREGLDRSFSDLSEAVKSALSRF